MSDITWTTKDIWAYTDSPHFRVEVVHWVNDWKSIRDDHGDHNWNIYIYIYPKHPHFSRFTPEDDSGSDSCRIYDFHGGATYFFPHRARNGAISSYQVGCDYGHLYDERFGFMETKDQAREIFLDAERMIRFMESTKADAVPA